MTQASLTTKSEPETIVLRPSSGWSALNLHDLWRYRELIFFLIWRDVKVRYKQTALGAAWAILQPVMQMVVFTFLFGRVAQLGPDDIPYPIFSYTALLPWGLFAKALGDAGRSLVLNRNMITKVYFPRLVIPVSSVVAGLVDFGIAFLVLLGLMWYYQITPTPAVWALPLFILLALVTALGVGLWLSALNVLYRDVGYTLPFLTQMWFFITPIVYATDKVAQTGSLIYALNPMVGVVEGFRWALLGTDTAPGITLWVSATISVVVLISGLFYFRRMERQFADRV